MVNSYLNYSTKPQSHVHCQPVVHLWCGFMAYHYTTTTSTRSRLQPQKIVTLNPEIDIFTTSMSVVQYYTLDAGKPEYHKAPSPV